MTTVALQDAYNMVGRTSWHGGPRTITASAEQGLSRLGSNRPKVRDGRQQITKEKVWTFYRSISGQHIQEEPRISAWLRTHVSLPGLGARCGEGNWRRKKGESRGMLAEKLFRNSWGKSGDMPSGVSMPSPGWVCFQTDPGEGGAEEGSSS